MSTGISCNGRTPSLPTLEVVKSSSSDNTYESKSMDWLLHIYYARGDFDTCKKMIDEQLDDYLNPEYLYFLRGLIGRHEERYFDALRDFQLAIDINSNNIVTYKEIGKTLYAMGRFSQSLGVFREAESLTTRPDHEIFHYIGELLQRNAKVTAISQNNVLHLQNEAKDYFVKAVQHGKRLVSYQKLAEIYRKEKDYDSAIDVLENCLQISPENTEILTEIAVLYLKINETQRAFDKLLEVTDIDGTCSRGLLAFGAILQSRNDIDGALGKYKQISGNKIESPELWNNIGICFYKKRKLIVAISCLRKTIWISPLNYNALYNLSLIFITAQQYASGFHTLAAAINLRKDSAECYMLLGICLRKLEDYENAFTAFERSAALLNPSTKNPLIYLNFALFCYEYGKIELSCANFNNFIKDSQDFVLSTEYKFYATKLKALLQQLPVAVGVNGLENLEQNDYEMPLEVNTVAEEPSTETETMENN